MLPTRQDGVENRDKVYLYWTLFFNKNVVFPAQAEYSYLSAYFRLKIFLYYS